MRVIWRTVGDLRRLEPSLFNRFLGERALADLIIEIVEDFDHVPTWRELCAEVEHSALERGEWLVAVPLPNLRPPGGYTPIYAGVGLGMATQSRDWSRVGSPELDPFAPFRDLGDRLYLDARWRPDDAHGGPLDTRRTAGLMIVEKGTRQMAVSVAGTRARFALAIWCLLKPPKERELWPTLGAWAPQPYLHYAVDHKQYEQNTWMQQERTLGRMINEYSPYELPSDEDFLRAPFEAMKLAPERRCARALLSASWALYLTEREPSDLERTDRLLHVYAAIDALCDPGGAQRAQRPKAWERVRNWLRRPELVEGNRWGRLTHRYGIWRELLPVYGQDELAEARRLTRDLRNIGAHGSDAALANLGYPEAATRQLGGSRVVFGGELALARAAASVPVIVVAAHEAATRLLRGVLENAWDDGWYEAQFESKS